jgi:hypothetical protein
MMPFSNNERKVLELNDLNDEEEENEEPIKSERVLLRERMRRKLSDPTKMKYFQHLNDKENLNKNQKNKNENLIENNKKSINWYNHNEETNSINNKNEINPIESSMVESKEIYDSRERIHVLENVCGHLNNQMKIMKNLVNAETNEIKSLFEDKSKFIIILFYIVLSFFFVVIERKGD